MDDDIKRFIELVKQESDKDEDFVMERVKANPLYQKLAEKYENINEVAELALKKSSWYERMRTAMAKVEKDQKFLTVMDRDGRRPWQYKFVLMTTEKDLYDKFMFRYSDEEFVKLANETYSQWRDENGKYIEKKNVKESR